MQNNFFNNAIKIAKQICVYSTIFVFLGGVSVNVYANSASDFEPVLPAEQTVGSVNYKEDSKIEDVLTDIKKYKNIKITGITSKFQNNGQEVTDFLIGDVTKQDNKTIKADLKNKRTEFVNNQKKLKADEKNKNLPEIKLDEKSQYKSDDNIAISQISFSGVRNDLEVFEKEITKNNKVKEAGVKKLKKNKNKENAKKLSQIINSEVKALAAYENRLPSAGHTYFGQGGLAGEDYNSTRWNFNYVLWNNNNFGSNDTYEHEVYLWNGSNAGPGGYKTYLSKTNSYGWPVCAPETKYAASTLPSPYLDTRLEESGVYTWCDNTSDEVSYTIGTSWAKDIQTNAWYYTYLSTSNGDRDKPVFKVQGQVGYNNYAYQIGTWSSFGYTGGTHQLIAQNNDYIINPNFSYPNNYYVHSFSR